jgi:hypothetical protein
VVHDDQGITWLGSEKTLHSDEKCDEKKLDIRGDETPTPREIRDGEEVWTYDQLLEEVRLQS